MWGLVLGLIFLADAHAQRVRVPQYDNTAGYTKPYIKEYHQNKATFSALQAQAEENNPGALFAIAKMYMDGAVGLPQDVIEGLRYMQKAAEAGHTEAMLYMYALLMGGKWVEKDEVKAANYLNMAAVKGHPRALLYLGSMHAEGINGFSQDWERGYVLFGLALDAREPRAQAFQDKLTPYMNAGELGTARQTLQKIRTGAAKYIPEDITEQNFSKPGASARPSPRRFEDVKKRAQEEEMGSDVLDPSAVFR